MIFAMFNRITFFNTDKLYLLELLSDDNEFFVYQDSPVTYLYFIE